MAYRGCPPCHGMGATCDLLGPPCRNCLRSGKEEKCQYNVWEFVARDPGQKLEEFGTDQQMSHRQCSQPQQRLPDALQSPNSSLSKVAPQAAWIPCELDHISGSSKKFQIRKAGAAASKRYRERQRTEGTEDGLRTPEKKSQSLRREMDQSPPKQSSLECSADSIKLS